ncbi:hypothetical protein NMY22_g11936 [Coprinellus aureogranulatus]|nr:hypothetical protein NMY22_g11936 [Coprinellus aureogranulatus]
MASILPSLAFFRCSELIPPKRRYPRSTAPKPVPIRMFSTTIYAATATPETAQPSAGIPANRRTEALVEKGDHVNCYSGGDRRNSTMTNMIHLEEHHQQHTHSRADTFANPAFVQRIRNIATAKNVSSLPTRSGPYNSAVHPYVWQARAQYCFASPDVWTPWRQRHKHVVPHIANTLSRTRILDPPFLPSCMLMHDLQFPGATAFRRSHEGAWHPSPPSFDLGVTGYLDTLHYAQEQSDPSDQHSANHSTLTLAPGLSISSLSGDWSLYEHECLNGAAFYLLLNY